MRSPLPVKESVILILLTCIHTLSLNANNLPPPIQQVVSSYCPYSDLCQSPARLTRNGSERTSCCAQCSCDNDCGRFDNCCIDKDSNNSYSSRVMSCKSTLTKDLINNNGFKSNIEPRHYRIEDTCPPSEVNSTLIQKCQGFSKEHLEDFVWVTDKQTGMIYQNKHCAQCRGVNEYTTWSVRTSCGNILSQGGSVDSTLLSNFCDIVNEVPSQEEARADTYACTIAMYSECNVTGRWDEYDVNIDTACRLYNWTYFYIHQIRKYAIAYKNVFCFLCNMPKNVDVPGDHCPDLTRYLYYNARTNSGKLSVLIDVKNYQERLSPQNKVCHAYEVWDSYMYTCRSLSCPFGKRPYFGKCTNIAITTDGLVVEVLLYFWLIPNQRTIPDNDHFHPNNLQSIGSNFHNIATSMLRLNTARCQQRGGTVGLNSTVSGHWTGFLVTSRLKLGKKCSLEFIIEQISEVVKQNVTYNTGSDGGDVVFGIRLYKYDDILFSDLSDVYYAENKFSDNQFSILIDNDISCPEININLAEHTHVEETRVKQNFLSLFNNTHTTMNATRTLCLHEYISVMSKTSGAYSPKYTWLNFLDLHIYIVCCSVVMLAFS